MEEKYFVYILKCFDDSYYVGSADNLENRVKKHNQGKACDWTKNRLPVELVYSEEHLTLLDARHREQQIKKWTRKKKENLINGIWNKPNK